MSKSKPGMVCISAKVLQRARTIESYFDTICAERGRAIISGKPDPYPGDSIQGTRRKMKIEARRRWKAAQAKGHDDE